MMQLLLKTNKGFSLLEVLIASLLVGVVAAYLMSIFVSNSGVTYQQNNTVFEGLSSNQALSQITEYVKEADAVASNYGTYTTGIHVLVLQLPGIDAANNIISNVFDYVVITADTQDSKILRLKVFPDTSSKRPAANIVLSSLLADVSFTYNDKNGNSVTPTSAFQVGTTLNVLSGTTKTSVSALTTLRNSSL